MKSAPDLVECNLEKGLSQEDGLSSSAHTAPAYQFEGKHLLASYSDCDRERLNDVDGLLQAFRMATLAAGATILKESSHNFAPCGLTAMLLLSESHASIHTYPEHGACFVDLFTCGSDWRGEAFDQIMQEYLRPARVQVKTILRHLSCSEL
jgi:S-adenosylmethionine decarboxylase